MRSKTPIIGLAILAVALPFAAAIRGEAQDGEVDRNGNLVHQTNLGFEVIEAVNGFTANGPVTLDIGAATIQLPQAQSTSTDPDPGRQALFR